MFSRRKVMHAVVLLALILFSASLAAGFTRRELHLSTHFDPECARMNETYTAF